MFLSVRICKFISSPVSFFCVSIFFYFPRNYKDIRVYKCFYFKSITFRYPHFLQAIIFLPYCMKILSLWKLHDGHLIFIKPFKEFFVSFELLYLPIFNKFCFHFLPFSLLRLVILLVRSLIALPKF